MSIETYDVAIVGAGLAGAAAPAVRAPRARVVVIEGEDQPGDHTTGRSQALNSETYGNASVRSMKRASRAIFRS
ncbi:MAG: FAD-dependent oxidoreductase, partial [Burkholderiales bacterium]|nr:FAD-dependent oxidoreductase [Burkholderiales bacterium]